LAADPNIFEKLAKAVAPSIYGYTEIKKAIVLQLFGGVRKQRSDGTFSRGDIHLFLVGDPGVAKSVMLKFISSIAPKGRYVAGKSTTGAGLTATVVRDEFMKGWALEAGAMVLSNRGMVCIDELEKMDPEDRSAMHEAMEQQTVTVSKANVQATLRAETSVLAAANPKFGRFDPYQAIAQQIDIPATLINRFDVIFMLRDLPERTRDEAIATHVLLEHRQQAEKHKIEPELLRKYIAYAKQNIKPELTDKAVDEIKKFYVELRNRPIVTEQAVTPVPITARQLEALIRLAEASARTKLSKKVTKEDAKLAIDLIKYYLMQVGFDYETNQIDIDKITTGIPASRRSKIILVREALNRLESRIGKLIPIEELSKELAEKLDESSIADAIDELHRVGDVFIPRKGYIQKV
jgi:replicative DNA helicase Mcm